MVLTLEVALQFLWVFEFDFAFDYESFLNVLGKLLVESYARDDWEVFVLQRVGARRQTVPSIDMRL